MKTERIFETLEHTADKGIAAYGKTMAEAFETAAYGMFSLFVDPGAYEAESCQEVEVTADDKEQLLWTWLSELQFKFEVERVLPVEFNIIEISDTALKASVAVRPVRDDIEWLGSPVKAITFHQLIVEETGNGWHVQVYVDV